jgi:hypothetical protein
LGGYDLAVDDPEAVPDGLVEHPPYVGCGSQVGGGWSVKELKGFVQCFGDLVGVSVGDLRPFGDFGAFLLDAGLLEHEHVVVDQVLVAELQQPLLFLLEIVEPFAGGVTFPG